MDNIYTVKVYKWQKDGQLSESNHIAYTHQDALFYAYSIKNDHSKYDYIKIFQGEPSEFSHQHELDHFVSPQYDESRYTS